MNNYVLFCSVRLCVCRPTISHIFAPSVTRILQKLPNLLVLYGTRGMC